MRRLFSPEMVGRLAMWLVLAGLPTAFGRSDGPTSAALARYELARTGAGLPMPNVELPKQVQAPEGKVTLYADFAAAKDNRVPLYLVNRTARTLSLPSQDGDLQLRLEYWDEKDGWVRAQPQYASECGNSYYSFPLGPGQYLASSGYMEKGGTPAKVRFASLNDQGLVSNEADGWYVPDDVRLARVDDGAKEVPEPLFMLLEPSFGERQEALAGISGECFAALRLAQIYGAGYYQKAAEERAKTLEGKSHATEGERQLARELRRIAGENWPAGRNLGALRERCLRALAMPESSGYGMPESFPDLDWRVLSALAQNCDPAEKAAWKPVVELLMKWGKPCAGIAILANPQIAEEYVPDSFVEKSLLEGDREAHTVCAQALVRRMKRQRLVELAWKLPPEGQIDILEVLAKTVVPPDEMSFSQTSSDDENEFVRHCMRSQPMLAAEALYTRSFERKEAANRAAHDPLHDFLDGAAAKSGRSKDDFAQEDSAGMATAVELLASWGRKEDNELLQTLLAYRGYERSEVSKGDESGKFRTFVVQRYRVREAARRALLERGVQIKEEPVLETEVAVAGQ